MPYFLQRNGASVVVTVTGESVVGSAHRGMKDRLLEVIAEDARHITIRLHGVEYLDSDALGMLVSIRKRAREAGGSVTLEGLTTGVHTLLDVTKLASLFTLIDCEPSAWHRGALTEAT
ncbi:MAG: STAS domain-containing protein [Gemmatimonadaceae bacterium]|nr:STAS domain-containing protein [Gemmatimonadaceae bacterium]NUR19536.1 STAS domain-containing protein [Gemmatimonadaceae bacterium]NUS97766.1 STAS domain-containing protein [Gemmatimonadaceae bacterium]